MNVKEYRAAYAAELAESGPEQGEAAPAELHKVAMQTSLGTDDRLNALRKTAVDPEDFEDLLPDYLELLGDEGSNPDLRMAALDQLKIAEFQGPHFDAYRASFLDCLRRVTNSRHRKLRAEALEVLAVEKDPFVHSALLDGLKDKAKALVSSNKAIQLLSHDDHSAARDVVWDTFESLSHLAKEEAIRLLASDPESKTLLERLLRDKSQRSSLRQICATGLRELDSLAFATAVRDIIDDEAEYNEIQATCLSTLANFRTSDSGQEDRDIVDRARRLFTRSRSTNLRRSIRRFLDRA